MTEITVNRANIASQALQKKQMPDGRATKPKLLNTTGDAGIQVYFLKGEIKDKFNPHFQRADDLYKEKAELEKKQQTNKTGLSKKDAARLQEVKNDLDHLGEETEELELKRGKIDINAIKSVVSLDDVQAIDFAIAFSEAGEEEAVELEITLNKAFQVSQALEKAYFADGRVHKPNLVNVQGAELERLYDLWKGVNDRFGERLAQIVELNEQLDDLKDDQRTLENTKARKGEKFSAAKANQLTELANTIDALDDELEALGQQTETVKLPHGKIKINGIKQLADADDLDAVGFAADFDEGKKEAA